MLGHARNLNRVPTRHPAQTGRNTQPQYVTSSYATEGEINGKFTLRAVPFNANILYSVIHK